MNSNCDRELGKAMTPEQFTQVVEAILEGKYSWACVLILRFAGYNPLHYIPYRTYNRLMKDHCQRQPSRRERQLASQQVPHTIRDLGYIEPLSEKASQVRGGDGLYQACREGQSPDFLWEELFQMLV
ncbi:MAG: HetP family heterocyst commitment protein [Synechococcales bacterium]|nr:HetP family heterocyst commitment protein [Synechococcales bacterium]